MIITGLNTNFSPFFVRQAHNRTKIPHTVKIVIEKDSFECCGLILAQHSPVLLDMILKSSEIYLDEFTGLRTVVEDCIDLMYGGEVNVNDNNIQTFFKFAKLYKIEPMVETCVEWVNSNIKIANLGSLFKVGFFVNTVLQEPDHRIIDICKSFMVKALRYRDLKVMDVGKVLGLTGDIKDDTDTISFLFNKDLLEAHPSVLPVITDWINSGDKSTLVLSKVEELNSYESFLLNDESVTREFVERLNVHVESLAASKILNKLQFIIMKRGFITRSSEPETFQASTLPAQLQTVLELEDHFIYTEKLIKWVKDHEPLDNGTVEYLWSTINQASLSYDYINVLRNTIMDITDYNVPEVAGYKFTDCCTNSDYVKRKLLSAKQGNHHIWMRPICSVNECICNIASVHRRRLVLHNAVPCYKLDLVEENRWIDHTHHNLVKHWYLTTLKDGKRVLMSLVTNTLEEVLGLLTTVPDNEGALRLHCLEIGQGLD